MAWKDLPYLAAAILFRLCSRGGDQARSMEESASGNDGTAGGASSIHTSTTEGQEVATSSGYDYEVFLNFRGPDTRVAFTDILYTSLDDAGILTFMDDKELHIGEEFGPELLQAINQSKILVPIFSKGYASSVWCLKELVQMVKCWKNGRQKIMPIFYDVAPSVVRYQTGIYAEAFLSHAKKQRYGKDTIREWKAALNAVGEINGWDLHNKTNRREGEFAREVTHKVFTELKKAYLAVSECLVSVDNHVDAIMEMIGAGTSETRIIGIHGMGGIGKTTAAKMIYNKLSDDFDKCCFLQDIRETSKGNGIQYLQAQLISDILKMKRMDIKDIHEGTRMIKDRLSNKRVLLLLDDVEEANHINALVGKHDWLGKGSKIIITTRKKDILEVPEVDCSYELSAMDVDQSLQLFSKHAFRKDYPLDKYIGQSKRAIGIVGGLPLALEIIGSLLCHTKREMWDLTLKKLENVPHAAVQSKLKISYDALDVRQQNIFLDIACLFIGYNKDIVVYFWDESQFPEEAMEFLQNMSLIKIKENNRVWMHDQLRDLGREIVRRESNTKIKEQIRVWDAKEGLDLLRKHKGETKVEALRLKLDNQQQYRFSYESFENLFNLRFLEVDGSMENFRAEDRLLWHESPSNVFPTNENSHLLPQLRWFSWHDIPPTFNITNFFMDDVVILNLSQSKITDDWKGWSHMKVMKNLKVLDMSYSEDLQRTPNFSTLSNLERLILKGCQSLIEIDRSICLLKCLVSLDVSHCRSLQMLPDELGEGLASLKYLSLEQCSSLQRLPNSIGNLELLIKLDISNTSIKELPDSVENLKNLKVVRMWDSMLRKIPDVFWSMGGLENILASTKAFAVDWLFHVQIGNGIHERQSLRILVLKNADIRALPRLPESLINLQMSILRMDAFPDLSNLTNLKTMDLDFGWRHHGVISNGLGEHPMPRWLGNLSKLEFLALHSHHGTTSPTDLILPPQLKSLRLKCPNLRHLPRLPSSLSSLELESCKSLCSMEDLSNLKKLSSLYISLAVVAEIQGLGCLENLQHLNLYGLRQVEILPDLSNSNKLTSVQVRNCDKLVEIQGQLPSFLDFFHVEGCGSLQKLPDPSSLMGRQVFSLYECKKLNVEAILHIARKTPRHFEFVDFEQLRVLPDLSNSNKLRHLQVQECDNLVEIRGELPQSLEVLKIDHCKSLCKLPNMSSLAGLREVHIHRCNDLVEIQGELPQSLEKLVIFDCVSLQKLPYLSSLIGLQEFSIINCENLVEIPGELPQSLEVLRIDSSCKSLRKFPYLSSLMRLREFDIGHCNDLVEIQGELPRSLEKLRIFYCGSLQKLPHLSSLIGLREFAIKNCDDLVEIPSELPQSLEVLRIDSSCKSLRKFPYLSSLMRLRKFDIAQCNDLVEIQGELPRSLENLRIFCCGSLQKLPHLSSLIGLRSLAIENCDNLVEIPSKLPQCLEELLLFYCKSLQKLPCLASSMGLRNLSIVKCSNLVEILGELPQHLEKLRINNCNSLQKLPYLSSSMGLQRVEIHYCDKLVEIQGELPQSLEELEFYSCKSLQMLPYLSSSMGLRKVNIHDCDNLVEIQGELPVSLKYLRFHSCKSLQKLPCLSSLMELQVFYIGHCNDLVEIKGELPQSLEKLVISYCVSLQKLSYLSSLIGLREFSIKNCGNLIEILGELPQFLKVLDIYECQSLQELPNLSSLEGLRKVKIIRCRKLNVEAISSLCSKMSVNFVEVDDECDSEEVELDDEYDSEEDE